MSEEDSWYVPSDAVDVENFVGEENWYTEYAEVVGVDSGGGYELLPEAYVQVILENNEDNRGVRGGGGGGGGGGGRGESAYDPHSYLPQLFESIFSSLEKAKLSENENDFSSAVNSITNALAAIEMAIPLQLSISNSDPRMVELLKSKQTEFVDKRNFLLNLIEIKQEAEEKEKIEQLSYHHGTIQQNDQNESLARTLLSEALLLDEKNRSEDALPLYVQSAEYYLLAISHASKNQNQKSKEYQNVLRKAATQVLDRIEVIKKLSTIDDAFAEIDDPSSQMTVAQGGGSIHLNPQQAACESLLPTPTKPVNSLGPHVLASQGKLTAEEVDVLRRTSRIHNRLFLPWVGDHKSERFNYTTAWEDPDGVLPLSQKQASHLGGWRRPKDFVSGGPPVMISQVSPLVITQDLVCDCSFVASLVITAAFERRWRKRLITGIIYPQNAAGTPVYNPSGKYLVKLWANGSERRVVVDDRLPCDKSGSLMTCYSNNKRELWVSIIEKAYMKLNGGYDFPGSNSGIDLYALTGWLPEVVSLKRDLNPDEANKVWGRLESAHKFGDCLITIATGIMDESEAERSGLVPTHAYAVLDVREISAADAGTATKLRLVLVKNPWARRRWLGNYSASDERHWTPKLKQFLSFDNELAQQIDNGIFWIDWNSLQKYFRSVHLNWNPGLFKHRNISHHHWSKLQGPGNDSFNYGPNPQFTLTVDTKNSSSKNPATIWVLLSRHVTRKENEVNLDAHDARGGGQGTGNMRQGEETDFVACHIYNNTGGRRVYTPKKPMLQGVYHSDPHILTTFDVPIVPSSSSDEQKVFTLVVSQLRKKRDIDFTIQVLCTTCPIRLTQTPLPPKHVVETRGVWNATNAGGPLGSLRFYANPQWSIAIKTKCRVHIELLAPKDLYIGLRLVNNTSGKRIDTMNKPAFDASVKEKMEEASSGPYSSGFCYLESLVIEPGQYTLVATTFEPNQHGAFLLKVFSSAPLQHLKAILPEGDGMKSHKIDAQFTQLTGVGCKNFGNYTKNPIFRMILSSRSTLIGRMFLPATEASPSHQAINLAVFSFISGVSNIGIPDYVSPSPLPPDPSATCITSSNKGVYTSPSCGVSIGPLVLDPGSYLVIPSTFDPWIVTIDDHDRLKCFWLPQGTPRPKQLLGLK